MRKGTNPLFLKFMPAKLLSPLIGWFWSLLMSFIFLDGASYKSNLRNDVTRPYISNELRSNPQMDWQLKMGKMEVMISKVGKTHDIHLLTHQLKPESGSFSQSVQLSFKDVNPKKIKRAGFKFGVVGAMPEEYRSNLFQSSGYLVGVTSAGKLFGPGIESKFSLPKSVMEDLQLSLTVEHKGNGFEFILEATNRSNEVKSSGPLFIKKSVRSKKGLLGNLTLFADYAQKNHAPAIPADLKEFQTDVTFRGWQISGTK